MLPALNVCCVSSVKKKIGPFGDPFIFWPDICFYGLLGRNVVPNLDERLTSDVRFDLESLSESSSALTIEEMLPRFSALAPAMVRFAVHMNSGKANLLTIPPASQQTSRQMREFREAGLGLNNSTTPITLVDWI